jgi:hypothetical protein
MVALKLNLPEKVYAALREAATQSQKSETELAMDAIRAYLDQFTQVDPLLGLFADEPTLIDRVEEDAMQTRERAVMRLADENGR